VEANMSIFPLIFRGRPDRDRMIVRLQLPVQSVHITTKVVAMCTRYNIM
jgi:hypothetical protein